MPDINDRISGETFCVKQDVVVGSNAAHAVIGTNLIEYATDAVSDHFRMSAR